MDIEQLAASTFAAVRDYITRTVEPRLSTLEDRNPASAMNAWALEFERRAQDTLQRAIDKLPIPANGKDGKDGLGWDNVSMEYDGDRVFKFVLQNDEERKEYLFTSPMAIYRGVYVESKTYERGDQVTWAGSLWHADEQTSAKPGNGAGWTLVAKRGRDGRDGERGRDYVPPQPVKV